MSYRLASVSVVGALLLVACSSSGQANPSADQVDQSSLSTDQAEMTLEGYIADYGLDTGDAYCDLEGVVDAIESDYFTATNNVNAAIDDLNESPFDTAALAAVHESGSDLRELAVVRSLLFERLVPLIDDSDAAAAMVFVGGMNDNMSLAMGEILVETTSAPDLAVSLSTLLESPASLEYLEGQADAYSILSDFRDQRCG